MTTLRELPPEERPAAGAVINEAKERVQQALKMRVKRNWKALH
ncbi:hypothetical protein MJ389_16520 [Escherichia coli]|nr:hypothetical protein MJ389_16520 [Escherichia coli]